MRTYLTIIIANLLVSFTMAQRPPSGAWEFKENGLIHTMIIADQFFSVAAYSIEQKKFSATYGGSLEVSDGKIKGTIAFNSADKSNVGKPYEFTISGIQGNEMLLTRDGKKELWKRIDEGKGGLSGNWRITSRDQNGQMVAMNPGARKTIKILSDTRFQWAAINTETGEFFGTGGGKYSFKDGKYSEMIEFFSRDSTRVGMSLTFDATLNGNEWLHSGKSSKGDPVKEIWTRK